MAKFPGLAKAWHLVHEDSENVRFDAKTARLLKLAIAIGAQREGAVRASARKAVAIGVDRDDLDDVVRLAASSVGFPATVAAFSWVRDELKE